MAHERFKACIDACNDCALACNDCASACLNEKDVATMARCRCAEECRRMASARTGSRQGARVGVPAH